MYHQSSHLLLSHTVSSLGPTSLKPSGKAVSASLSTMPCLLPWISPQVHLPSCLLYLLSHSHLSEFNSCFIIQLKCNKIFPSKNFLVLSLRMNSFFQCITIAFLVHTSFVLSYCFHSIMPHMSIILPIVQSPIWIWASWQKGLYLLFCFAYSTWTKNTDELLKTDQLSNYIKVLR